jgi:hypothetical protein
MPASSDKPMIDRFAELLADISTRFNGRSMATVERIITGPTTTAGVSWLVVLYRSTEVSDREQVIGYGGLVDEDEYARLPEDQFRRDVREVWSDEIDEPPGSDLPDHRLNPGGIAWWERAEDWSAETGPPVDGLPATRTYRVDERPEDPRTTIIRAFNRAIRDDIPPSLRCFVRTVDLTECDADFYYDEPIDERARRHVARIEEAMLAQLPPGISVSLRAAPLSSLQASRASSDHGRSPTAERKSFSFLRPR